MNGMIFPHWAEPRKLLDSIIDEQIPAIMTYLSRGKWHVAKIQMVSLGASKLKVQVLHDEKPHPVNIQLNQPVGISVKYRYGKVVFDTTVIGLEPSAGNGGQIVLIVPDRVEIIQRRAYFRVSIPKSLKINVTLWHRQQNQDSQRKPPDKYWQSRLVDMSAGGLQVVLNNSSEPDFHTGQFVTLRFTPLPYEQPLMFNAQIRNVLPTADGSKTCLGMQTIGLEASPEGREVLQRLCTIVEQYYQMNQPNVKQSDVKTS